jgi:hypothetical protein
MAVLIAIAAIAVVTRLRAIEREALDAGWMGGWQVMAADAGRR